MFEYNETSTDFAIANLYDEVINIYRVCFCVHCLYIVAFEGMLRVYIQWMFFTRCL